MAKIFFALAFTLIVSASIPSPVFAVITRGISRGVKPSSTILGGLSLSQTIDGYLFSGSERRNITQSYGLKVGYERIGAIFLDSLGVEGTLNYFTTKSKADASDATGYIFRLDAIYPFVAGEKWMPFFALGGGRIVIDSGPQSEKRPLFNYGVGLKYFLEDYLAVRADARHLLVYSNVNTRSNFEVGIGMSYYFGKERKKKKTLPPVTKQEEKKPEAKGETPAPVPPIPSIAEEPPPPKPAAKPLTQAEELKQGAGAKTVVREGSQAKIEDISKPADKGAAAAEKNEAASQKAPVTTGVPELPGARLEAERREQERVRAEKIDKESIHAIITLLKDGEAVPVGGNGTLPVEITNTGKSSERFLLTVSAAKEFNALLARESGADENTLRLQLAAGETFKGAVVFRMPEKIGDGERSTMLINVVSARYSDVSFQKEAVVTSSAPLMRVVAKFAKPKVTPGEKLRYHITVLNAGSQPARNLSVRLKLPPQVDFRGAPRVSFKKQPNGTLFFNVDKVETGTTVKIDLDVEVRKDAAIGQELRGVIEVVNDSLQRIDSFTASGSIVQAK